METKLTNAENLTSGLVEKIKSQVLNSTLRQGDIFMTVKQISTKYGVSRTIAREATSHLQALGLLKGKKRVGLIVTQPTTDEVMHDWLPLYAWSLKRENFLALGHLRYALELGSLDLASANATEEQLKQLTFLAEQFARVTTENGQSEEANRIEFEFHCLLLTMTGTPLIMGMHRVLTDFFHQAKILNPHWNQVFQVAVNEHRMIAEALAVRDTELARCILRRHIDRALEEYDSRGNNDGGSMTMRNDAR